MNKYYNLFIAIIIFLLSSAAFAFTPSGLLEIHYINVQTAGCVLVIGPDGTTLLMDGGDNGDGYSDIIPYFQSIGLTAADDLDYMMANHLDSDHCGGLDDIITGGYDVLQEVYYNGSSKTNSIVEDFFDAAATTTAGSPVTISLGTVIDLGDGATATCVYVGGYIYGGGYVNVGDEENDLSVVMLIEYGDFQYIYTSDVGGGTDDEWCTNRYNASGYANVETPLTDSLVSPTGANLLDEYGVEVAHVGHHGSEGSGNSDYMNNLNPAVACINVGWGQSSGWDFPRHDVVDNVFMAEATSCVTADPALVLQTEEGSGSPDSYRSYAGYPVGDIIIKTNGDMLFEVSSSGRIHAGTDDSDDAGLPLYLPLDEDTDDTTAPTAISDLTATGGPNSDEITLSWSATGDDGATGTAAIYEIRYRLASEGPISGETAWEAATEIEGEPSPQVAGSTESFTIADLANGTGYYFAIKAIDDNLNYSGLSNSPSAVAGYVTLLFNGDMEQWDIYGAGGPPDYWSINTSSITAVQEASLVHGDDYSVKLTWTDTNEENCEFSADEISITAGMAYTCSLYVYDYDYAGYVTLYYRWDTEDSWGPTTNVIDDNNWQLLTFTETAPTGATSLEVVFRCYDYSASWDGNASIYLDDITLDESYVGNQAPEITSLYRIPVGTVYADDNVAIRVLITDDGTVAIDSLYYQMSTTLIYTAISHDSIGTNNNNYYWFTIPAADAGTLVEYYAIAQDDGDLRVESSVYNYTVGSHPQSIALNGDFELWETNGQSGPPDNWAMGTSSFTATRESSNVHGGSYSANLTWTSQDNQMLNSDTIDVVAGTIYPCSVYVYDNDTAGRFRLCFISDGGNTYPENYSADQNSWQQLGYTWAAPTGATYVVLQFRLYDISASWDGNATVYVDDLVFIDTTSTAIAPVISSITRYPADTVESTDNVLVSALITDDGSIAYDSLYFEASDASLTAVASDSAISNTYWYTIGTNTAGVSVSYYVVAIDDQSLRTQSGSYGYEVAESGDTNYYAYVPGDANMINAQWPPQVIGGDVTYLVNYFRGINQSCPLGSPAFYAAADVNGDCNVIGSDVTKLVSYFRGTTTLSYCVNYPPLWLSTADCPIDAPTGWPNCSSTTFITKFQTGQSGNTEKGTSSK